ncbi:MAG: lytic transglycosylase domain-containing protein [Candidatus Binatia bacterium]
MKREAKNRAARGIWMVFLQTSVFVALSMVLVRPGPAAADEAVRKPSREQLARLDYLEPYIRYFTSLSYGPNDARVSADYIRALILTESGGHLRARSRKGARGLTQIIPSTARWAAAHLARDDYDYLYVDEGLFENFDADDLYNPAINILLACYLNATYNDRFGGRTELVAAAWNAGPGAVTRHGNNPPPYPETRVLISRVLGYMDFFQAISVP